jgi:hypothetical protein
MKTKKEHVISEHVADDQPTFGCKQFGHGTKGNSRCKKCLAKFAAQFEACQKLAESVKAPARSGRARVPGFFGYAIGSKTDQFCNLICTAPFTMADIKVMADETNGGTLGPHPKCLKKLTNEGMIERHGQLIAMRVWPKGHAEAGKLTPAVKALRALVAEQKAAQKAA